MASGKPFFKGKITKAALRRLDVSARRRSRIPVVSMRIFKSQETGLMMREILYKNGYVSVSLV